MEKTRIILNAIVVVSIMMLMVGSYNIGKADGVIEANIRFIHYLDNLEETETNIAKLERGQK